MWGAFIAKSGEKAARKGCFLGFNSGKARQQDAF